MAISKPLNPARPQDGITLTISREQNALVRSLLESNAAFYKNIIAGAVEVGADEYARTGLTGFEYAATMVPKLRATEALYHTFVPDDMVTGTYNPKA